MGSREAGILAPRSNGEVIFVSFQSKSNCVLTVWYNFVESALKKLGAELYQKGS